MEAKIDTAAQDLDAFGQGGPAMQTPTAITDRMHGLLVTRADALEGCISTSTSFSSKSDGLNVDIYLWADGC